MANRTTEQGHVDGIYPTQPSEGSAHDKDGKIYYQEVLHEPALHHIQASYEDTTSIADTQFSIAIPRYKSLTRTTSVTEQGAPQRWGRPRAMVPINSRPALRDTSLYYMEIGRLAPHHENAKKAEQDSRDAEAYMADMLRSLQRSDWRHQALRKNRAGAFYGQNLTEARLRDRLFFQTQILPPAAAPQEMQLRVLIEMCAAFGER